MMKYSIYAIFNLAVIFFMCIVFKQDINHGSNEAENLIFDNLYIYQNHQNSITNFSFLNKYKNLKILDLSGSGVRDLSFIKQLKKLQVLVLNHTDIEDLDIKNLPDLKEVYIDNTKISNKEKLRIKHFLYERLINNNHFSKKFSNFVIKDIGETFNYKCKNSRYFVINDNNKELNYLTAENNCDYNGILGITKFSNLEVLKYHFENNNELDNLVYLYNLRDLHIIGPISKIPYIKNLSKIYLYKTNVTDFSFLKDSDINYLYIVTEDFDSERWKKLKNRYSDIKIEIKSLFWLPGYCNKYKNKEHYKYQYEDLEIFKTAKHLDFTKYLLNDYCYVIRNLKENKIDFSFYLSLADYKVLINEVNIKINHIWSNDYTLLDKAIEDENMEAIEYLIDHGAKQSCEILKEKCSELPDDIQKIIDKNR